MIIATNRAQRTRIKICGLTRGEDVDAAVAAGADAVGFVLYKASPRYVSPERAAELARHLPLLSRQFSCLSMKMLQIL